MMEMLLNFCYYITLFCIPIAFYSLILKHRYKGRFYTNRDWYYIIKLFFAWTAVRKYQKKCKLSMDEIPLKLLENPKEIQSDKHNDNLFIYGADQKGNSLSLRFIIRSGLISEIFLCLRLATGVVYTLPDIKTKLYSLSDWQWKTKNLQIDILEPFKRIRIYFNGLMSNANDDIEHVQFTFIWASAAAPKFYPQDAATGLLVDSLARQTWRDGDWLRLLGDERGYEQFGSLHGNVRGDSFPDDLQLNLPSCRTRFWGTAEKLGVNRSIHLFIAGKDGTLFSIWVKNLKRGCSGLQYGNVILSNGAISPIANTDLGIECLGQHGSIPAMFVVHIEVGKKTYKTVFHLNTKKIVDARNEESRGYQLSNVPAECDLNTSQARALVEFWHSRTGDKDDFKLPPPLLIPIKTEILPNINVSSFPDEESRIVKLTGGKGCSLAMLASLKSTDFTVPDGFIVTVNAFNKQLDVNFNMKKAVSILDDICCGRSNGNLEQACKETVKTFQNEQILPEIVNDVLNAMAKIQSTNRWAVRSSAVGEDSEELSAAGQNETFLGCKGTDDVIKAISSCWASLFTYQSVQYRHQHGLPIAAEMAVVVQTMVPADSAGVLFTCHPSTENPANIVITANHGLGESVVSGKSEPDCITLQRTVDNDLTITSKILGSKTKIIKMVEDGVEEQGGLEGFSITDNQALELGRVGIFLEDKFGSARDIEWAYHQGRLFLLQSRPVTTLNSWSDSELLHEFDNAVLTEDTVFTTANVGEVYPTASTALSLTTSILCINQALQFSVNKNTECYTYKCLPSFQRRLFIDVINSIHPKVTETISLQQKIVDLTIFGHPVINETINSLSIQRFGVTTLSNILDETYQVIKLAWNNEKNLKKLKNYEKHVDVGIDTERDTLKDMFVKIDNYFKTLTQMCLLHCYTTRTSMTYQILAMTVLAEGKGDFTNDHYNDAAMLLSSCEDVVSAEVPIILSQIVEVLAQKEKIVEFVQVEPQNGRQWLEINCPEASKIFEKFLQDHGHRTLGEFELCHATWATNHQEVIKMIQANCKNTNEKQAKTNKSIDDVIDGLITPKRQMTKKILKFLMKKNRRAVGIREQSKSAAVKGMDKLRIAYGQLATKMAHAGLIPNPRLIYHLSHYEVGEIIEKKDNPALITKALKRQKLYKQWNKMKFPELIYGIPEPESDEFIVREGVGTVKCTGTPVRAGVVKARACVITDLEEIGQLVNGDILITHCTDIGWSPYFPMLSGIVTELGGLVSHGAVIAREYGLPCIVGVKGATRTFKTGDIVILSGKTGTIELLEDNSN